MAALSGKSARIKVTSAVSSSSTNNAATLATDGQTLTINSTAKRHWDRTLSTGLTVFAGAGDVTADLDATQNNYVQGIVVFSTPHSTALSYTIDVDAFTASYLGFGRNWTANVNVDMNDVTAFSTSGTNVGWRSFQPGLAGASVSIERFWAATTGPAFFDRLNTETALVVELVTNDATAEKLEGYAYVAGEGFTVPVDGTATENVDLTVDGQLYLSTA